MPQNQSLAEELKVDIPLRSPGATPLKQPEKEPVKRTGVVTKIERVIMSAIILLLFGLAVTCISMEVTIFTHNRQLQDIRNEITIKQEANIDLKQEISELSSYARIYEIATQAGLKLNESNVKGVSE